MYNNLSAAASYAFLFFIRIDFNIPLWHNAFKDNRVAGWLTSILHRMGVVLMDKKKKKDKNLFDFKDLMSFGMFILALLTFIYLICH